MTDKRRPTLVTALRMELGKSQADLATKSGLALRTVGRLENRHAVGEASADDTLKSVNAWLLDGEDRLEIFDGIPGEARRLEFDDLFVERPHGFIARFGPAKRRNRAARIHQLFLNRSPVLITAVTADDFADLNDVQRAVPESLTSLAPSVSEEVFERDFLGSSWVAKIGGRTAGLAMVRRDSPRISHWVHSTFAGRGAGQALLNKALECVKKSGHSAAEVEVEASGPTERFLQRRGWTRLSATEFVFEFPQDD